MHACIAKNISIITTSATTTSTTTSAATTTNSHSKLTCCISAPPRDSYCFFFTFFLLSLTICFLDRTQSDTCCLIAVLGSCCASGILGIPTSAPSAAADAAAGLAQALQPQGIFFSKVRGSQVDGGRCFYRFEEFKRLRSKSEKEAGVICELSVSLPRCTAGG